MKLVHFSHRSRLVADVIAITRSCFYIPRYLDPLLSFLIWVETLALQSHHLQAGHFTPLLEEPVSTVRL